MTAPRTSELQQLRPNDWFAWLHVAINFGLTGSGIAIAALNLHPVLYLVGQIMLALGFTQAFVLLHEAGHRTLFRQRRLNDAVGYVAGFLALIPYSSWRPIHARHHRYTGWQDLDATTASLVPRPISKPEQVIIDVAWRFWLPLFSIIYRIQNYWRVKRIGPFLAPSVSRLHLRLAAGAQLLLYAALCALVGVTEMLVLIGPGLFLSLMGQDLLLLSQHTGMPTNLSHDAEVTLFPPMDQEVFTRSLRLPGWLSWLLLHFDAHELHHLYPAVPSYHLRRIDYTPPNEVSAIQWLREVKSMTGTQFLFGGAKAQEVTS